MKQIKLYILIVLYWVISLNLVSYFGIILIDGFMEVANIDPQSITNALAKYWISPTQLLEATLFGAFFGILFVAINEITQKTKIERYSFGKIILIKSLLYLAAFIIAMVLVFNILYFVDVVPENAWYQMYSSRFVRFMILFSLIFMGFQIILLNFILQTIKKFGPNNLLHFLVGKYQSPVLEDRIFLFMDLKSSTTYAERLGNLKYSQLIQDCFDDINQLVEKFNAEIYQYVGDEVILTWKTRQVLSSHDYIKVFYSYREWLEQRADYYLKKYDLLPEFKAGLHGGWVTVAEIGNIKREIAYHGDVMNTTSRLQSICNQYHEQLLISGELLKRIGDLNGYSSRAIGEIQLKGKQQKIEVFAIAEDSL
ncbi:MAG: adenylate/guanylate cyclase domain-containing protein [Cyclobacteriaceae bacterium]|nr:adenylate/guanylate cyclase domain-containing protein [Cyclobacteriaceae bacterium]